MKKTLFLIGFLFLLQNTVVTAEEMKIEQTINLVTDEIKHVVADKENERIYIIASKNYYEEELIALDLEGNEVWRYSPNRYVDYEIYLLENGNVFLKTLYATKLLTNGYDVGGSKLLTFTPNGNILWEKESDKILDEISISNNNRIIAYNNLEIFNINNTNGDITNLYAFENLNSTKYASIYSVTANSDHIKVIYRNQDGTYLSDINYITGELTNTQSKNYSNDYFINRFGDIVNKNGNFNYQGSRFIHSFDESNYGLVFHLKGESEDNFVTYSYTNKDYAKFNVYKYDYAKSKILNLNDGVLIDDYGNIFYTQENRLLIRDKNGLRLKEFESPYISDIFLGDLLDNRQMILFSRNKLYVIDHQLFKLMKKWTDWQEQYTDDTQKKWVVRFTQKLDPKTVNTNNIFVSMYDDGDYEEKIKVDLSEDGKSIIISSQYSRWYLTTGYLFITDEIKSLTGESLKKNTRMKFTIKN